VACAGPVERTVLVADIAGVERDGAVVDRVEARLEGFHRSAPERREGVGGAAERRQLGQSHERRRRQFDFSGALRRERVGDGDPAMLVDLAAVHFNRRIAAHPGEEPGIESLRQRRRRDPARYQHDLVRLQTKPASSRASRTAAQRAAASVSLLAAA
jgi:hypothetical protein